MSLAKSAAKKLAAASVPKPEITRKVSDNYVFDDDGTVTLAQEVYLANRHVKAAEHWQTVLQSLDCLAAAIEMCGATPVQKQGLRSHVAEFIIDLQEWKEAKP